jgi:Cu(I)/Ag(I) efflux system membrane fusion protein
MKKKYIYFILAVTIIGLIYYFSRPFITVIGEKSFSKNRASVQTDDNSSQKNEIKTEEPAVVEIPVEKQQLIGVKTTTVELRPVQKSIRTVGRIEIDERGIVTINTKFEGWIEKLYADRTGIFVQKGEPLAEIYSPDLYATQLEFINAIKWNTPLSVSKELDTMLLRDNEMLIDAIKQRLKLWDITDEQIKKIEDSGKPFRTLTFYSPVNGYVIKKSVFQGMRVMPGERLFEIADLSTVWVIADIYEYELPLVDVGQDAEISLSYIPNKIFKAKIEYVYPYLSGDTRTMKIRFSLPNYDGLLKPQMFTEVVIKRNLGKRLIIPEDSVIDTGLKQIVYVDKGDGYFEQRKVVLGLRADGVVEVLKGLKAGEKIATSATFLIDSEARLKGIQ